MASLRDERRSARRDLHDAMKVPALYFAPGATDGVPVGVRIHTKFPSHGDLDGGGSGWAEQADVAPRLIFYSLEQQPARGAMVSVEPGEAYLLGLLREPDDQFVTAEVTPMSAAQIAAKWPDGQPEP